MSGRLRRIPGTLFCTQTTKSNVDPGPPGGAGDGGPAGRFLCYKLKCPKAVLPTVTWNDQFGSRTLTTRRSSLICAPEIVTTTTTTTTSPTPTTFCRALGAPCGSCGNGVCLYHCPANSFVCVANTTPDGGPCALDSTCTNPDYPTCAGIQPQCNSADPANFGGCRPRCL